MHNMQETGVEIIQIYEDTLHLATVRFDHQRVETQVATVNGDSHDLYLINCYAGSIRAEKLLVLHETSKINV